MFGRRKRKCEDLERRIAELEDADHKVKARGWYPQIHTHLMSTVRGKDALPYREYIEADAVEQLIESWIKTKQLSFQSESGEEK